MINRRCHFQLLEYLCPFFFYGLKYSTRGTFLCIVMINPQVVKVFAGLLEEISKQIGGLSSQNTELHVFVRNILKV